MSKRIEIISKREKRFYKYALIIVSVLFIIATVLTQFNPLVVIFSSKDIFKFLVTDFLPPKLSKPESLFQAIFVTLCLAVSSTFIAGILAFIASMFGSEKISPFPNLSKCIRAIATFLRNIPELVWAFILFSALGIGTGVGFIALVITTFSFMTRAFIETIDDSSSDSTEGLLVVGATFPQRIFHSVVPSCIQDFISWFLYCIEVNIRASTIVGMVGGGGIGLVLFSHLKSFNYHIATGIILIIAFVIIGIDLLTNYLRKKVLGNE